MSILILCSMHYYSFFLLNIKNNNMSSSHKCNSKKNVVRMHVLWKEKKIPRPYFSYIEHEMTQLFIRTKTLTGPLYLFIYYYYYSTFLSTCIILCAIEFCVIEQGEKNKKSILLCVTVYKLSIYFYRQKRSPIFYY